MRYIALTRLKVNGEYRWPGDEVPEAKDWKEGALRAEVGMNRIAVVPDHEDFETGVALAASDGLVGSRARQIIQSHYSDTPDDTDDTGDDESNEGSDPTPTDDETVASILSGSVNEVIAYAKDHPEDAEALYLAEVDGENRSTLIPVLEKIIDEQNADDEEDDAGDE